jgi:hypothetical protein
MAIFVLSNLSQIIHRDAQYLFSKSLVRLATLIDWYV